MRGRWLARAALAMLVGLVVWGILGVTGTDGGSGGASPDEPVEGDYDLYVAIVDRMDEGSGYYAAVGLEQAERGYPTRPVQTVREPGVAWIIHVLGEGPALALLGAVVVVAFGIGLRYFDLTSRSRGSWLAAVLLLTATLAPVVSTTAMYFHEMWAAPLIVIGLLSRRDGAANGWSAVALGLAAILRELAAPILLVVAAIAWKRGQIREACAMLLAFVGWACFYAWHAVQVADSVGPSATANPGWLAFGGWPFVVETLRFSSALVGLPVGVAILVVPLALLGWASRTESTDRVVFAVISAFLLTLTVVGRDNNLYWGLLIVALVVPGLASAPGALIALVRRSAPRRSRSPLELGTKDPDHC